MADPPYLVMVVPPCGSCFRSDAEGLVPLRRAAGGGWAFLCTRCAKVLGDSDQEWHRLVVAPWEAGCTEADVIRYVESQAFQPATSMPDIPHSYVLLHRSTDPDLHLRAVNWIRRNGEPRRWRRAAVHRYWSHGDWEYWAMPPRETILNRRNLLDTNPDGTIRR